MENLPDLTTICKNYLDNADLKITKTDNLIVLNFRPFGWVNDKFWQVIFTCKKPVKFSLEYDEDFNLTTEIFVILDVFITQEIIEQKSITLIRAISGNLDLQILCEKFSYQIFEIDEKTYHDFLN